MFDTLGSTINDISSTTLAVVVILAVIGLLLLWGIPFSIKSDLVQKLTVRFKSNTENLSNMVKDQVGSAVGKVAPGTNVNKEDLVGKYLTRNIFNKEKKVIGLKGNLVSEEMVDEASKENLLSEIEQNSSNWPPKA